MPPPPLPPVAARTTTLASYQFLPRCSRVNSQRLRTIDLLKPNTFSPREWALRNDAACYTFAACRYQRPYMYRSVHSGMVVLAFAIPTIAQAPDIAEPGSIQAIAAATTDPHYVSSWVSYVPQSTIVPSPEKFFGRIMSAPGELLGTERTYSYARAL